MADNALGALFSEIASAIREKSGVYAPMKPIDFPENILSIPVYTGGGSESGGESGGATGSGLKITSGTFRPDSLDELFRSSLTFQAYPGNSEYYYAEISPSPCVLTEGQTYVTNMDGRDLATQAKTVSFPTFGSCVSIGSTDFFTSMKLYPYIIGYSASQNKLIIFTKMHNTSQSVLIVKPKGTQAVIEHGLGEMPDFVMVCYDDVDIVYGHRQLSGMVSSAWGLKSSFVTHSTVLGAIAANGASYTQSAYGIDNMDATGQGRGFIFCPNESTFVIGSTGVDGTVGKLMDGQQYSWTAMSGLGSGGGSMEGVHTVTFMSEDGQTELFKRPVADGDNCADPVARDYIDAPTKESTNTQTFTYSGWATTPGGSADSSALSAVTADKTVYAAFTASTRYYTIRFFDGDTLLHTVLAEYGSVPSYTPTKEGYNFVSWNPEIASVTGNAEYYAQWEVQNYKTMVSLSTVTLTDYSNNTGGYMCDLRNECKVKFSEGQEVVVEFNGETYELTVQRYTGNYRVISNGSTKTFTITGVGNPHVYLYYISPTYSEVIDWSNYDDELPFLITANSTTGVMVRTRDITTAEISIKVKA